MVAFIKKVLVYESGFSRDPVLIGDMYYKEELAHTTIKANKSHRLPSAIWRSRKAGGVIQSKPKGLKTRGADALNPTLKAGED